jgi:dynein heavy chain
MAGLYQCPCYYYPNRAGQFKQPSFVIALELKSSAKSPDLWIKRGTAALLNLDH